MRGKPGCEPGARAAAMSTLVCSCCRLAATHCLLGMLHAPGAQVCCRRPASSIPPTSVKMHACKLNSSFQATVDNQLRYATAQGPCCTVIEADPTTPINLLLLTNSALCWERSRDFNNSSSKPVTTTQHLLHALQGSFNFNASTPVTSVYLLYQQSLSAVPPSKDVCQEHVDSKQSRSSSRHDCQHQHSVQESLHLPQVEGGCIASNVQLTCPCFRSTTQKLRLQVLAWQC